MKTTTREWLEFAKDDLDVAERIKDDKHLTNMVAFHSHQVVEKCIKSIIEEYNIGTQRIHNLITLSGRITNFINYNFDEDILRELNEIYISTRYPVDLGLMPYGKPSLEDSNKFYIFATTFYHNTLKFLETKSNI